MYCVYTDLIKITYSDYIASKPLRKHGAEIFLFVTRLLFLLLLTQKAGQSRSSKIWAQSRMLTVHTTRASRRPSSRARVFSVVCCNIRLVLYSKQRSKKEKSSGKNSFFQRKYNEALDPMSSLQSNEWNKAGNSGSALVIVAPLDFRTANMFDMRPRYSPTCMQYRSCNRRDQLMLLKQIEEHCLWT